MRYYFFFFFNDTATTEIYTLSLHDALPISVLEGPQEILVEQLGLLVPSGTQPRLLLEAAPLLLRDRKSTRLNSSHGYISYAVFCLKKKKKIPTTTSHLTQPHHEYSTAQATP